MEEVKVFKEGKKHPGKYIYDLFDTIEAQQREVEQLQNRCFAITKGMICMYCELQDKCPRYK